MRWFSTIKRLPKTNDMFGESDMLLCYTKEISTQFVGWYDSRQKAWFVAHYKANHDSVRVDYWKKLDPNPGVKIQRKRINGI